ncbi:MAG: alpha-glucosidase C-terminal domain-containing protein, partial [Solobacterium sp.]|nr:alpha-glucosidase C-terminal domain-containing protein [Solobacterium sp.]
GWNTLVLENHDNPRCVNRFSIDTKNYRYEAATMLAAITYMGFGTPFIYMGQEVGLTNCDFKNMDELKDPVSHFVYDLMTGYGLPKALAFRFIKYGARDHARVPMSWDGTTNGGFNTGHQPWQCVNPLYKEINVEKDLHSDKSIYRYYKKLLQIRKKEEAVIFGEIREYDHPNKKIIAYSRTYNGQTLFVLANFSKHPANWKLPDELQNNYCLLNNYDDFVSDGYVVKLKPYQAVILEVL